MDQHVDYAPVFKALGDTTRLKIIEMLSCGELCECDILDCFEITQPTLLPYEDTDRMWSCNQPQRRILDALQQYPRLIELVKNYWTILLQNIKTVSVNPQKQTGDAAE